MKIQLAATALAFAAWTPAAAQTAPRDPHYDPTKPVIEYHGYNVRLNTGIQTSYFIDAGFSFEKGAVAGSGFGSYDLFVAFSAFPSFNKETPSIFGVKAGGEFCGNGLVLGLELAGYRGFGKTDVLITPKAGLGVGLLNVVYGYGFSTNGAPFGRIGLHTFALQANLPLKRKDLLHRSPGPQKR